MFNQEVYVYSASIKRLSVIITTLFAIENSLTGFMKEK